MSCNQCAATSDAVAGAAGAGGVEALWAGNRDHPQFCGRCHAFLRTDGGCTRCEGGGQTLAAVQLTPEEQIAVAETESLARLLRDGGIDPLNNEGVQRLHTNYVSISCGQEREVILDPTHHTAATDLNGKVYLNPYPLGGDGKILDQMVIAQSYIDHELLHELFTPKEALDAIVAAANTSDAPNLRGTRWDSLVKRGQALSPAGRAIVKDMLNVLEDGRIERLCEQREPFMWQRMLAGQAIQPKDGHARNGGMARLKPYQQVMWATQIEVQPNYTLTPDIYKGMTPEALQAIKDLRPLIKKAGHGSAYDAVEASIEVVEEMDRMGLLVDGASPEKPAGMSVHESGSSDKADGDISPEELPGDWSDAVPESDDKEDSAGGGKGDDGPGDEEDSAGGGKQTEVDKPGSERCPDCGAYKTPGEPCEKCADNNPDDEGDSASGDKGDDSPDDEGDSAGGGKGDDGPDDDGDSAGGGKGDDGSDDEGDGSSGGKGDDSPDDEGDGSSGGKSDDSPDDEGDGSSGGKSDDSPDDEGDGSSGGKSDDSPDDEGDGSSGGKGDDSPDDEGDNPDDDTPPDDRKPGLGGGDEDVKIAKEFEETEEMRRRQEEIRRQQEEALRKARMGAVGDFRRAIKVVTKETEKRLGKRVANGPAAVVLPFTDHHGRSTSMPVRTLPGADSQISSNPSILRSYLKADAAIIGRGANAMASAVKKMRMQVEKAGYLKKKGSLDRRRMVAAIKGSERVRMNPAPNRDLSMAASISYDRSGSMNRSARELGTIAGILSKGLEKAGIPYEARSYTEAQFDHKTFGERKISDKALLPLYTTGGGNDDPVSVTLGGAALTTRPEAAKVQFVVTDGEPACRRMSYKHPPPELADKDGLSFTTGVDEVRHAVRNNQAKGIIVQAVFYAKPSGKSRADVAPMFDYMYGPGNWAYIAELGDLPKVVTKTLTAQIEHAAK